MTRGHPAHISSPASAPRRKALRVRFRDVAYAGCYIKSRAKADASCIGFFENGFVSLKKGGIQVAKSKVIGIIFVLILISGCSSTPNQDIKDKTNSEIKTENSSTLKIEQSKVEKEILFMTTNVENQVIEGVTLMILGYDGNVIDTIMTDKRGEIKKVIKVDQDKRYPNAENKGYSSRGTVTVIAFKDGYKESVLFEVAVSDGTTVQNIIMDPLINGERNEPKVLLGYNHHLEVLSLVDKYAKIIGKEAHY